MFETKMVDVLTYLREAVIFPIPFYSLKDIAKYLGFKWRVDGASGLDSIMAAIYPRANDYWYFLTTLDGEVKYGKDLDGHNRNVQKYLR